MSVKCDFVLTPLGYECFIRNQEIPSEINEKTFVGEHFKDHSNENVQGLRIWDTKMPVVPKGLGKVFKNVTYFDTYKINFENISKDHLEHFPKLRDLRISSNKKLESVPGDLFEVNKKIKTISFSRCNIKVIGDKLLQGLKFLDKVNFRKNPKIDFYYSAFFGYSEQNWRNLMKEMAKCNPQNSTLNNDETQTIDLDLKFGQGFLDDFNSKQMPKDFTIKINSIKYKIHKIVFEARSQYFAEMFRANSYGSELVLTGISNETFESILKFIYTDEAPQSNENIKNVFIEASKFKIQKLKDIAADMIIDNLKDLNVDSLMENLNLGLQNDCEKLKLKAFEEIRKHFPGRKLKDELSNEPEKLKKMIELQKQLNELMGEDEGETSNTAKRKRK